MPEFFFTLAIIAVLIGWWIDENRNAKPVLVTPQEMDKLLARDTFEG